MTERQIHRWWSYYAGCLKESEIIAITKYILKPKKRRAVRV